MESVSSVGAVATQETYSSYYSTDYKLRFSINGASLKFCKVDNNAKVRGQKLNEQVIMNARFGLPE